MYEKYINIKTVLFFGIAGGIFKAMSNIGTFFNVLANICFVLTGLTLIVWLGIKLFNSK